MKTILFPALAMLAGVLVLASCGQKDWAATVDGQTISMSDFNTRYETYMQLKRQQPDFKPVSSEEDRQLRRMLLKNMIGEILIYKQLKKEGFENSKDIRDLLRQFMIQKYLEKKLVPEINITQAEVDAAYRQNKEYFKGMDPEVVQQRIQYQLTLEKFEGKTSEMIEGLYLKSRIRQNDSAFSTAAMPAISLPPVKSGK